MHLSYYDVSTAAFFLLGLVWSRSSWLNMTIKAALYLLALAGLFEALQARGILINI